MDPLKRLISIAGVILLFGILYGVFSAFFTDVAVNQQFPVLQPNHVVLFSTQVETSSISQAPVTGELYYISYQKGRVLYLENLSMRTNMEVVAYFSKINTYRDGPLVGSLLASHGNVTLYVPSDIVATDFPYVVFWSGQTQQVVAYANMTQLQKEQNI